MDLASVINKDDEEDDDYEVFFSLCWLLSTVVERRSFAGELSLSCA